MKDEIDTVKSIIDSIHRYVWVAIINTVTLFVCWLTAIYLLAPKFYSPTPVFIHLIVGITLATQWYLCSALTVTSLLASERPDKVDVEKNQFELMIGTYIYSLIYLGTGTFVWLFFEWPFSYLVAACFAPSYILSVIWFNQSRGIKKNK